jgi:hypothetical protein
LRKNAGTQTPAQIAHHTLYFDLPGLEKYVTNQI